MGTSGHKAQFGVDTTANPALITNRTLNTASINRVYRGGFNDTRPPFQLLNAEFENEEDEGVFRNGSLTSLFAYDGVPPYSQSRLVATVGRNVYVGVITGNTVYFKVIHRGLDASLTQQFPCQAEQMLVINNGKTRGVFWDGQTDRVKSVTDSIWIADESGAKWPMPIGNITLYAHGRLWVATESGIVYASDHLYSQGNSGSTQALLRFKEQTYPSSGGGFTAPATWGDLRGMAVIPRDPSTNGHGEIVVFHLNGIYSVTPLNDRTQWGTSDIQQTAIVGHGAASPYSIATINNDILFRSNDKRIKSLRQTASQRSSNLQIQPISNEVLEYLKFDSYDNLRFTMSGVDDERLFFTVNHDVRENNVYIHGGYHRYANGLVCCDLSAGSSQTPDTLSWDGLWTGPRVTGIANMLLGTERRAVFSSFDLDGQNRLYTISQYRGSDETYKGSSKIVSMYVVGNLFDGLSVDSNGQLSETKIDNHVIFYSNCEEGTTLTSKYSPSFSGSWYEIQNGEKLGGECESCLFYELSSGRHLSKSIQKSVTDRNGGSASTGVSFDLMTIIEGSVRINSAFLTGTTSEATTNYKKPCGEIDCESRCDDHPYFTYQF